MPNPPLRRTSPSSPVAACGFPTGDSDSGDSKLSVAMISAFEQIGGDGSGRSGLVEYLICLARKNPSAFARVYAATFSAALGRKRMRWAGRNVVPYHRKNIVREAVIAAAGQLGFDGRGSDGLCGYWRYVAKKHPAQFATMLASAAADKEFNEPEQSLEDYFAAIQRLSDEDPSLLTPDEDSDENGDERPTEAPEPT